MVYYRTSYSKIPTTQSKLYNVIKDQATKLGYDYDTNTGGYVIKNDLTSTNTIDTAANIKITAKAIKGDKTMGYEVSKTVSGITCVASTKKIQKVAVAFDSTKGRELVMGADGGDSKYSETSGVSVFLLPILTRFNFLNRLSR